MGLDGQTLPTRRDCTRVVTRPEDLTSVTTKRAALGQETWSTCALSHKPLWEPIVVCGLGRLYRREEVLVELCDRKHPAGDGPLRPPNAPHITSTKDVLQVVLCVNPASAHVIEMGEEVAGSSVNNILSLWKCPITGHTTTGTHTFIVSVPCAHVTSQDAIKALGTSTHAAESRCPSCGAVAELFEIGPSEEIATAQLPRFRECMRNHLKKRKGVEKKDGK